MLRFSFALLLYVLFLPQTSFSQNPGEPGGDKTEDLLFAPPAFATLERLPLLPGLHAVHQFSSHNKKGHNGDSRWHLYDDEKGDAVIFDMFGPGCVRSMWGTDIREGAVFHFYFDHEEEPRYSIPMLDFYQGKHPLFSTPLVSYERRGHWGDRPFAGNSFVPIPFAERLKISVSGHLEFYHILFDRYPHGTTIDTFTGHEGRGYLLGAFEKTGGDRPAPEGLTEYATEFEKLDAGQSVTLLELDEPGCIRQLVIEGEASDTFMQDCVLRMNWDHRFPTCVHSPLGFLFGSAVHATEMHTLSSRVERLEQGRVRLTTWFPMPFWVRCHIQLVNRSENELGPVKAIVSVGANDYPQDRSGYFSTCHNRGWTTYGRDWPFIEAPGTGWYVGAVQSMLGEHYCEGDERIYIDHAISPQINGTGSEDYFLACFWPNLNFNSPFANCVGDTQEEGGGEMQGAYHVPSCYSRFHLEAPVPFFSHIDARIQHGGLSTIKSQYGSTGFAYIRHEPSLIKTDFIDVESPASEAAHDYAATASTPINDLVAHPEGSYFHSRIKASGRRHAQGTITFIVAIDTKNSGVRLRRRLDQSVQRQCARVHIDGTPVGTWYDPDHNEFLRWYDSDFDIHPRFTAGKERLEVRLETSKEGGCSGFTDFQYEVFSFVP